MTFDSYICNFNSRTHVECDKKYSSLWKSSFISTHALTWSATAHAVQMPACPGNFNSRTHVECDCYLLHISINRMNFNSRTHVECDLFSESGSRSYTFQLTHSRGVRLCTESSAAYENEFQLTHSRGVRLYKQAIDKLNQIFQLTHSRGVRLAVSDYKLSTLHFNSRTHVECDVLLPISRAFSRNFNSRTHVECDIMQQATPARSQEPFQLTHSRGVRQLYLDSLCDPDNFNSRTHVECDSKYCIKKRFTTQYMGIYCFLSSIILIFFIYSKK